MKKLLCCLLAATVSAPAFAETTISVYCQCSFYEDYIIQNILAKGTRTNPTPEELEECVIEKGKVISGCWAAKMNAQFYCQNIAQARISMGYPSLKTPNVMIHDDACYGDISEQ